LPSSNMSDPQKMFLEAYEAHAEAIYRHCYFRVFSRARAEELMQDTFMKTWQYLQNGNQVENIRAFLYQVANNLIIDDSRKKKEESLDALREDDRFEPASDGHRRVERLALAREVREVMDRLSPGDREILVMRYIDDLDPREIAETLGITPNAASVRIHRATQALRELIDPQQE
jgi:RNA polymerase sigma-70 factor, ECF subfamily